MDLDGALSVLSPQRRSVDRIGILNDELSKEQSALQTDDPNVVPPRIHQQNIASIQSELSLLHAPNATARSTAQPISAQAANDPLSGALSVLNTPVAMPAATAVQAPTTPPDEISPFASAAAGAGEATGRGVLAVQQLAGKGVSWLGDVLAPDKTLSDLVVPKEGNILQQAGNWLQQDAVTGAKNLAAQNAPYQEANPKSSLAGEVTGLVASPVNKLIPGGGSASTLVGSAAKGAAQGSLLNILTSPVTDEDHAGFWQQKAQQGTIGAIGGAAGGSLANALSTATGKVLDSLGTLKNKILTGDPAAAADKTVTGTLDGLGVDVADLKTQRPGLFEGLKTQVQDALSAGKTIDADAVTRLAQAQLLPVPVPMLKGQVTRDAMQFAKEQNLRGIQGVGEPITQTLTDQNKALIGNLDALGAKNSQDVVSAGQSVIDTLTQSDNKARGVVKGAYDAFKQATGRDLDVPLAGLAQDYARTVSEFGDAIPSAIKNKFEGLGLMSGQTQKTFNINDAEGLIKSINLNYDPANLVQARALNDLRGAVQRSIVEGAGASAEGTAAAGLAQTARGAAAQRFQLIDQTPGLKAAIQGAEPDKFLQKYVMQGNVSEIRSMVNVLKQENPIALSNMQDSVMGLIKNATLNGRTDANATFSGDQLKKFVQDPNMSARLQEVLGPGRTAQLKNLYEVAENATYAPVASAVNRSNTASAAANLVKSEVQGGSVNSILDWISKTVPGLSGPANIAKTANQAKRAENLVSEAVNPALGANSAQTGSSNLIGVGGRAGAATLQEKTRRLNQP